MITARNCDAEQGWKKGIFFHFSKHGVYNMGLCSWRQSNKTESSEFWRSLVIFFGSQFEFFVEYNKKTFMKCDFDMDGIMVHSF